MKRMIKADRAFNNRLEKIYYKLEKPSLKNYRFSGQLDEEAGIFWGQISRLGAYDDAEYWWARINGGGLIELIYDGKVREEVEFKEFDEDAYETVSEYMNEMVEYAAELLREKNKNIEPRMMYN